MSLELTSIWLNLELGHYYNTHSSTSMYLLKLPLNSKLVYLFSIGKWGRGILIWAVTAIILQPRSFRRRPKRQVFITQYRPLNRTFVSKYFCRLCSQSLGAWSIGKRIIPNILTYCDETINLVYYSRMWNNENNKAKTLFNIMTSSNGNKFLLLSLFLHGIHRSTVDYHDKGAITQTFGVSLLSV